MARGYDQVNYFQFDFQIYFLIKFEAGNTNRGGVMKKKILQNLLLLGALLLAVNTVFAGIPVQPGDLSGFRTTPAGSGISSTGGYTEANGGMRIEWSINFDGTFWNYTYTFTDKDESTLSPDASHWILEISPEVPFGDISDYIFNVNATVETPPGGNPWQADPLFPNQIQQGANGGNPNLGTNLYGIKFDTGSEVVGGVYTFKSTQPPVWGDFYIK